MRPFLTLHEPATARSHYEKGLWTEDTFYSLFAQNQAAEPDGLALRDGRQALSWSEVRQRVDALADDLRSTGLTAGDRVSIWMSNRAEAVIAFLACSREGFACNPSLHRTYTGREIIELLRTLDAAALVTESGWSSDEAGRDYEAMKAELPSLKKVYQPEDFPAAQGTSDRPHHGNPDTVAYLAFTSGTTGAPKCVMHSSNTLLANGRDMVRDWSVSKDTVLLTLSPLSHHIAWVAVSQWLISGCVLVTDDAPAGTSRLDWIVKTGATYVMGVPTHAMDILGEMRTRGIARLGEVKIFYMAGAPIPSVVAEDFVKIGVTPQNIYGMTENSSHQYTHPSDPVDVWTSTCGRGGRAYEVAIFDVEDADRRLGPGESGQIGGRGAALMLGYYGNQPATMGSFNKSGWFLSGDLGSLDEDGNLRIDGRIKDLIIRGGHNIYPSRIEALAVTHEGIAKAAAFPVPDDRLGEKVCLAIIGDLDADAVLDHLAEAGLSKYDMPEWYLPVPALPLTASGKILKRELAEMVKRGELQPVPVRYNAAKAAS